MKKRLISMCLSMVLCLTGLSAFSQQGIEVITRNQGNKVALRWVPTTTSTWKSGISGGYTIKRTLTHVNGSPVTNVVTNLVTSANPVKPDVGSSAWQTLYAGVDSSYAIMVKTSIDSVGLSTPDNGDSYHFMSLLGADMSFNSAVLGGLAYVDNSAVTNETYTYEVALAANGTVKGSESSETNFTIPQHKFSNQEVKDSKVYLAWNADSLNHADFVKYYVERSLTNSNFVNYTPVPFTNTYVNGNTQNVMSFIDTNTVARQTYYYRLKAVTLFGEQSYSPSLSVYVKGAIPYVPAISETKFSGTNLQIKWKFPADTVISGLNNSLSGFVIQKSADSRGQFTDVIPSGKSASLISKNDTSATFSNLAVKTFLRVVGMTLDGDSLKSIPVYSMPVDSVKPNIPLNVKAVINKTTGISRITWSPNTLDTDVQGYKVFRANRSNEEPIEITHELVSGLAFNDTLKMESKDNLQTTSFFKINNPDLYYYVSALDHNFNQSDLSAVAMVKRPDKEPPLPPLITGYWVKSDTVYIDWDKSLDTDVKLHKVVRAEISTVDPPSSPSWITIVSRLKTDSTSFYIDRTVLANKQYVYAVVAEDDSANTSFSSLIVVKISPFAYVKPVFTSFTHTIDQDMKKVSLAWVYPSANVKEFQIYRGEGSNAKSLWTSLKAPALSMVDETVLFNTSYSYSIRAILNDGAVSPWKDLQFTFPAERILTTDFTSLTLPSKVNSQSVNVTSNLSWTVSSSASWLTTSVSGGTNNGTMVISAQLNSATLRRTGTVTLTSGSIVKTIEVNQMGVSSGTGLTAKYYNVNSLAAVASNSHDIARLETNINLNTGESPAAGIAYDFAAVWEGFLEVPETGDYSFYIKADDGAKLFINNQPVLSCSAGDFSQEFTSTPQVLSVGQKYSIRLEFYDVAGGAAVNLHWSSNKGLSKQLVATPYVYPLFVPTANDADMFNNKCFNIRVEETNKLIQAMPDYSIKQFESNGRHDQKWKFVKVGNYYKIISQIDKQNKVIQVVANGNSVNNKLAQGYFSDTDSNKWEFIQLSENRYQVKRSNSDLYMNYSNGGTGEFAILHWAPWTFLMETTTCPNYSSGIILDKEGLDFEYLESSQTISLKSDTQWSIDNPYSWINVSPPNGLQNSVISISAAKNTVQTPRSAFLTFKNPNGNVTVKVNQKAAPCLEVFNAGYNCSNQTLETLNVTGGSGQYQYMLDNSGTYLEYQSSHRFISNGSHKIYVRDKNNYSCTGSLSFNVGCY